MVFQGKKVCYIEIYDETNDNMVIAKLCDTSIETTNGYKVRVVPYVEEVKSKE